MCCCIPSDPVEDKNGTYITRASGDKFQVNLCEVAYKCPGGPLHCLPWFCGQFIPFFAPCTQCLLRRKVLDYDMSKYQCCQGYFGCCGVKGGACGESSCPDLCALLEGCCCNSCAISASRMYIMEKHDLRSDPCDYRIIWCSNMLQILACICQVLAIFYDGLEGIACIIEHLADLMYMTVSGCMTVQTSNEVNYQKANPKEQHAVEMSPQSGYGKVSDYDKAHYGH